MMVWNMLLEREMDTQLKGEERTGEWNLLDSSLQEAAQPRWTE